MTIKEIAEKAHTSRGTVDRVIHNRGKVNPELKETILKIIKEYGYEPNVAGRSLSLSSKEKQYKIGAVISSLNHSFFGQLIDGLKAGAERFLNSGISLILKEVNMFNKEEALRALDELKKDNVNILILSLIVDEELTKKIEEYGAKVIALNIDLNLKNKICFIGCDYLNSGRLAANVANLILKDNSNICMIVGSFDHEGQQKRIQGFKEVMNKTFTIVDELENLENDELSYKEVKEEINNKKIDLFYFLGAGLNGGLKAIRENNDKNLRVITVDNNKMVESCLKDGLVTCSIVQHPYTQGVKSIEYAYMHLLKAKELPKVKIIENSVFFKESIIPHLYNKEEKNG